MKFQALISVLLSCWCVWVYSKNTLSVQEEFAAPRVLMSDRFQSLVLCCGSHTNIKSYELLRGLKLFSVLAVHCALSKQAVLIYNSPWKFLSAIPSGMIVLLAQRCLSAVAWTEGGDLCIWIWTIILKAITVVGKLAAIACCCSYKLDMTSAQVFKIQFCCSYKTSSLSLEVS